MTEANQQPTILQQALAHYDACLAGDDEMALALAEQHLTETPPSNIYDLFALLPRLTDKSFSDATREKITVNAIRASRFIEIEFGNVVAWIQAREQTVANYRNSFSLAAERLAMVDDTVQSARSILSVIKDDPLADSAGAAFTKTASDLAAARALFQIADEQLKDPALAAINEKDRTERVVFEEYLVAKRQ